LTSSAVFGWSAITLLLHRSGRRQANAEATDRVAGSDRPPV
jgi:hypothetical protein